VISQFSCQLGYLNSLCLNHMNVQRAHARNNGFSSNEIVTSSSIKKFQLCNQKLTIEEKYSSNRAPLCIFVKLLVYIYKTECLFVCIFCMQIYSFTPILIKFCTLDLQNKKKITVYFNFTKTYPYYNFQPC
jgi:hypothetical protein